MSTPSGHRQLDAQREHWQRILAASADRFGTDASTPARAAAQVLRDMGATRLLELGAGQGRDTLFFASEGFSVTALDYAASATEAITAKLEAHELEGFVEVRQHDLREPLPFPDGSFDACYSHMLFTMALASDELAALAGEVHRVLRPGGLCIYTVRHVGDAHYGAGRDLGDNLFENGGFVVHFFDRTLVHRLAEGFELEDLSAFEEGDLPRRLWRIRMRRL